MSFNGNVAIVTGGSRGLGRGIAIELGKHCAKVVVNYHANADAANEVVQLIKGAGSEALAIQSDVSQYDAAHNLIKAATEFGGRLDILVNNAGTTRDMLLAMMPEADWDLVIATNLKSAYNCSKAALRPMMRQKYGRIVNITSVAGLAGNPRQTNYSASKAGLIGFTKSLESVSRLFCLLAVQECEELMRSTRSSARGRAGSWRPRSSPWSGA